MSEKRARGFNRRLFLKGTAAVSLGTAASASLGTAVSGPWMAPAAAAEPAPMPPHGAELRGMDLVTQSPTTEGRFGFFLKGRWLLVVSDPVEPSLIPALMGLAETYRQMGRNSDAIEHYERYIDILPNGPEAPVAKAALERLKE